MSTSWVSRPWIVEFFSSPGGEVTRLRNESPHRLANNNNVITFTDSPCYQARRFSLSLLCSSVGSEATRSFSQLWVLKCPLRIKLSLSYTMNVKIVIYCVHDEFLFFGKATIAGFHGYFHISWPKSQLKIVAISRFVTFYHLDGTQMSRIRWQRRDFSSCFLARSPAKAA